MGGGMGGMMPGGKGGMQNERGTSGMSPPGGGMGPPGSGGMGNRPGAGSPNNMVKKLELMDVDKITNHQSLHFSADPYPRPIAGVTGTIPFNQQPAAFP